MLLTKVNEDGGAEVFYTNLDELENFECIDEGTPMDDNGHEVRFTAYINKNPQKL